MFKNRKKIFILCGILVVITFVVIIGIFIRYKIINNENSIEVLSKYGSTGDEVKEIQTKLKRWGYYTGEIDGTYGSKTVKAVKYFQKKNGLTQDRSCRGKNFICNGDYKFEFDII